MHFITVSLGQSVSFSRKISLSCQNNHWLSQTQSSLLNFSVQYSERGYVLWNLSTVCGPHHHDPWFIDSFYFIFFNRSSINLEVLLIKIILFFIFDHWSNDLFKSNQRFQAIEFVDRHVPEKLDMGFLCATNGAASRVRDSQVESYPYKHTRHT